MLVRVTWLGLGVAAGALGARWAERTLRRKVAAVLPEQVLADLAGRGRLLGSEVRTALAEGRQAMAERETALWARLDQGPGEHHPALGPGRRPRGRVIDVGPAAGPPTTRR